MSISPIIKEISRITNWRGNTEILVERHSASTNKTYTSGVSETELKLIKLLETVELKLTYTELNTLRELIEEYGQDEWSRGCDDANCD